MIDISIYRGRWMIVPAIPVTTDEIDYVVSVEGDQVFVGKTVYFGGTYEIDTRDFIDAYIAKQTTQVSSVTVSIDFTYYAEGTQLSTQTKSVTWTPDVLSLPVPAHTDAATWCQLVLMNCGFEFNGHGQIRVPLQLSGLTLVGKTINNLEKITYIDRYGDTHNGSLTNHYELEVYVDPEWLNVKTNNDLYYEMVMLALQNSQKTTLCGVGEGGFTPLNISGIDMSYHVVTRAPARREIEVEGRVKDVQKVETYSSYSTQKKLPTIKVTFEIYI